MHINHKNIEFNPQTNLFLAYKPSSMWLRIYSMVWFKLKQCSKILDASFFKHF